MRIPQLVSFYHVARLSSMSKAAEQLHLGQPTVTTHLKKLEDEFGVMLFDRIKRPIQLTSDGATILELIAPIVNGLTSLQAYVDDPERHGSLTIAAYSDLVLHYLPRVIQVFRAGFPEVHVRLLDRSHEEMIQMIKVGEVDLALSIAPTVSDPSMNYLELFRSSTVLLTPFDHELLGRRPVTLSDIARWPLIQYGPDSVIRGRLERELGDRGIDHETVLEMDNAEFIKRYVRIGMGVGICSGLSLEPDDRDTLGVIEVDHLLSDLTIGVYTLRGKFQGNAVRNFIAGLRETSPSH